MEVKQEYIFGRGLQQNVVIETQVSRTKEGRRKTTWTSKYGLILFKFSYEQYRHRSVDGWNTYTDADGDALHA